MSISSPSAKTKVEIAKEVINNIKSNAIKATPNYFWDDFSHRLYFPVNNDEFELKNFLEEFKMPCATCAVGALFISAVLKYNDLKVSKEQLSDTFWSKKLLLHVSKFFEKIQIVSIEIAFEGKHSYFYTRQNEIVEFAGEEIDKKAIQKLLEFYSKYENTKDRMIGIMDNIIANNGDFVP